MSSLIPQRSPLYCPWKFSEVQLLLNAFGVFGAFYRGHFSHDFRAQGVTLKSKALATKCIFQIYSQLLDSCTRLVFKTAEELILPSVILWLCMLKNTHTWMIMHFFCTRFWTKNQPTDPSDFQAKRANKPFIFLSLMTKWGWKWCLLVSKKKNTKNDSTLGVH